MVFAFTNTQRSSICGFNGHKVKTGLKATAVVAFAAIAALALVFALKNGGIHSLTGRVAFGVAGGAALVTALSAYSLFNKCTRNNPGSTDLEKPLLQNASTPPESPAHEAANPSQAPLLDSPASPVHDETSSTPQTESIANNATGEPLSASPASPAPESTCPLKKCRINVTLERRDKASMTIYLKTPTSNCMYKMRKTYSKNLENRLHLFLIWVAIQGNLPQFIDKYGISEASEIELATSYQNTFRTNRAAIEDLRNQYAGGKPLPENPSDLDNIAYAWHLLNPTPVPSTVAEPQPQPAEAAPAAAAGSSRDAEQIFKNLTLENKQKAHSHFKLTQGRTIPAHFNDDQRDFLMILIAIKQDTEMAKIEKSDEDTINSYKKTLNDHRHTIEGLCTKYRSPSSGAPHLSKRDETKFSQKEWEDIHKIAYVMADE